MSFGIIRYAPGSGPVPEHDVAGFDGWYADREIAAAIFEDWKQRFPQWIVALVEMRDSHFGNGDFSGLRDRAIYDTLNK